MLNETTTIVDKDELRELIAEELELSADQVTDEADFKTDLSLDSLVAMEILMQLEQRYGVSWDESELVEITSLNRVHELLTEKLAAAAS